MSIMSGLNESATYLAASLIMFASPPNIWTPIGLSSSSNRIRSSVLEFSLIIPSADTNSE